MFSRMGRKKNLVYQMLYKKMKILRKPRSNCNNQNKAEKDSRLNISFSDKTIHFNYRL